MAETGLVALLLLAAVLLVITPLVCLAARGADHDRR